MARPLAYLGQAAVYGLIALLIGYFSAHPRYDRLAAGQAEIVVSFSHAGARVAPCRKLSPEEIAEMAANMRRAEICGRERHPLELELDLDGRPLYRARLAPAGLARDGASQVHVRLPVAAGSYRLDARLRDTARSAGFDHTAGDEVGLTPGQRFVVDFRPDRGGFVFGHGARGAPSQGGAP